MQVVRAECRSLNLERQATLAITTETNATIAVWRPYSIISCIKLSWDANINIYFKLCLYWKVTNNIKNRCVTYNDFSLFFGLLKVQPEYNDGNLIWQLAVSYGLRKSSKSVWSRSQNVAGI